MGYVKLYAKFLPNGPEEARAYRENLDRAFGREPEPEAKPWSYEEYLKRKIEESNAISG
ncbi:MAG: hypothetical protein ABIH23_20085 [bacterium]